jgi:hypothetical protein
VTWQKTTTRRACAFLGGLHGFALDHLSQGAIRISFITLLFLAGCWDGKRVGGMHQVAWVLDVWHRRCHTLKYSILGCEYLLQYVYLSIGFSKNFKDFSGNYYIYVTFRYLGLKHTRF